MAVVVEKQRRVGGGGRETALEVMEVRFRQRNPAPASIKGRPTPRDQPRFPLQVIGFRKRKSSSTKKQREGYVTWRPALGIGQGFRYRRPVSAEGNPAPPRVKG